jgi:hypothetical protein
MLLNQLQPGTSFHLDGLPSVRATLVETHGGGSVVSLSRPKTREFTTLDGRQVVFHDPGRKTETWSSETPVIPE